MTQTMGPRICLILTMSLAMCSSQLHGQTAVTQDQRDRALALERQGNNAEAEAAWRVYLKAHPASPEPYAHLGLLEARQEHYKEAAPLYSKALALSPSFPGVRLNLGLALFKGGELKQSIEAFLPLLKSQPPGSAEEQRLTILIGTAYYGLAEYAKAVPYFTKAAANDKQNLPLRLSLAHSCLWSKQYKCVLDTYHEILTIDAESAEADMLAGEALDEMKDTPGAIRQFRAAGKANPKEPNVHYGLGYLLWIQKEYAEAASEFRAELDNNPNHAQAMTYLADTEIHLNHHEVAWPLLEKSLRIDPDNGLTHLDLGIVYTDLGRKDEALKELKEAARLDPEDVNVHWRLGRLYRLMGKVDEAKAEFEKASSLTKAVDSALVDKVSGDHPARKLAPQQAAEPVNKP